jgi:hypothetical protein
MFDTLKKKFARSNIKDATSDSAPTQKIVYTASQISLAGQPSSCSAVMTYLKAFVSGKNPGNRLFVGELNKIYPNCSLVIDGNDFGQMHSIGYTFDDKTVVLRTSTGSFEVARER